MATRQNPLSQLGAQFGSIAQLFGPPKAADAYAYAKAAAERGQEARRQGAYDAIVNPGASRDAIDRYFIGGLGGQPDQTYGVSQDQINAAARRNAEDNARALEQTRLQQGGENYRAALHPIVVGKDATAFLPEPAQKALGLGPALQGQISAQPGEIIHTPTGETIEGAPQPLTFDQWKAREAQGLRTSGGLSDQDIARLVAPPGELEKIVTPEGPRFATRSDAVGQTPYEAPKADRIVGNYRTPGGGTGVAVAGAQGELRDSQTGEKLPPGVQTFRSQAQGSVEDVTKTTQTALQQRKLQFDRLLNTADLLEKTIAQGAGNQGLVGAIRGTAQDAVATMHELGRLANVDTSDLEARAGAAVGDPNVAAQLFNRDGTISPVRLLSHVLASQGADVLAGGDRTSNQQLNQMISALGQDSLLSNPARTKETLATLRAWIASQRAADEGAFGGKEAPAKSAPLGPAPTVSGFKILQVR